MRFKLLTDSGWRGARTATLLCSTRDTGYIGAGYIGGFTLYAGWRPNIARGAFHVGPAYFGFTRNGNRSPLCSH